MDSTPEKQGIVVGHIAPIKAGDLLPKAFAKAEGLQLTVPIPLEGVHQIQLLSTDPVVVAPASLDYAAGVATRTNSRKNRLLIQEHIKNNPGQMGQFLMEAASEMHAMADDVIELGASTLHDKALAVAQRVTSAESLATLPHTTQAGEMIALAYAVLHYAATPKG